MINPDLLNLNISEIKKIGKNKITDYETIAELKILLKTYKQNLVTIEDLRNQRNQISVDIKKLKAIKNSNTQNDEKLLLLKDKSKKIKIAINNLNTDFVSLKKEIQRLNLTIPNFPAANVPYGTSAKDNREIKKGGVIKNKKNDHLTYGLERQWIDVQKTVEISGTRFASYTNECAALKRALIDFMLDFNIANGFNEISTPVIVKDKALFGTGQLPKFKNDLYNVGEENHFLIPTSEVTIINFFNNKIFNQEELPIKITQASLCFRQEAGAAGKDTHGIIRLHQFDKVEIVCLTKPEASLKMLHNMVSHVEELIQKLELPYRIIELCTGELGFAANKTFDLEVWLPSQQQYREISSCSNCGDFQARRTDIKYRINSKNKAYVHTLNGSSLAVDRLIAAFIENHKQKNGKVYIPEPLRPYFVNNNREI